MSGIVLSQFRSLLREGEVREERPPRRRVLVDREGRIVVGDDAAPGRDDRQLSEVHPAVFA